MSDKPYINRLELYDPRSKFFAIMALIGMFISLCGIALMIWKLSLVVYGISAMFFGVFLIVVGCVRDAIDRAMQIQRLSVRINRI